MVGIDSSSFVPSVHAPCDEGYRPVMMDERVGVHSGFGQYALVKSVPSRARRSRFGVLMRGFLKPSVE